jgi:hypothetical protein
LGKILAEFNASHFLETGKSKASNRIEEIIDEILICG